MPACGKVFKDIFVLVERQTIKKAAKCENSFIFKLFQRNSIIIKEIISNRHQPDFTICGHKMDIRVGGFSVTEALATSREQ